MGAIAEGMLAYAQPLLEQTDGSHEQIQKAMSISMLCFNLAIFPEASRGEALMKMQKSLQMEDEEFAEFMGSIIIPMIQRHKDMFPVMHRRASGLASASDFWDEAEAEPQVKEKAPSPPATVPDRYAPCPCNSGKKYKFCCGMKRR